MDDYSGITDSLLHLKKEMISLKSVVVDEKTLQIEYFLGGDWNFLATVCGIGQASHDIACIWCLCPRTLRSNEEKDWPLMDPAVRRSINSITQCTKKRINNCMHAPFFDDIELDHVIIDTLHLFLRVADILIDKLIQKLKTEDDIEKEKKYTSGKFDVSRHKHMAAYLTFVESHKIPLSWTVNHDTKKLTYRTLTGPEKISVLQRSKMKELLPLCKDAERLQKVWGDFGKIYEKVRKTFTIEDSIAQYKLEIKNWLTDFLYLYQARHMTPYMHALLCHVPQFLQL